MAFRQSACYDGHEGHWVWGTTIHLLGLSSIVDLLNILLLYTKSRVNLLVMVNLVVAE